MVRYIFATVVLAALCGGGARAACVQAHIFVTGEVLTAAVLNANPAAEVVCINNITSANIGAAGIFASQIIPANTTQARFGGTIGYTFPSWLDVGGGNAANLVAGDGGFSRNASGGAIRLGGGSASGTLDFGVSTGGVFTLNGGALVTRTAQSCGTPSGYHIECGILSTGVTCANGADCTFGAVVFTTAYASNPVCNGIAKETTTSNMPVTLNAVSPTGVTLAVHNGSAGAVLTGYYLCIGV